MLSFMLCLLFALLIRGRLAFALEKRADPLVVLFLVVGGGDEGRLVPAAG